MDNQFQIDNKLEYWEGTLKYIFFSIDNQDLTNNEKFDAVRDLLDELVPYVVVKTKRQIKAQCKKAMLESLEDV